MIDIEMGNMDVTTQQFIETSLNGLKTMVDIDAFAIISRDGLLMADVSQNIHAEVFAAMSATLMEAAEIASSELQKGSPNRVIVESKKCKIITTCAGPRALLAVVTNAHAGLGSILVEMEKAAKKIQKML